MGWVGVDLDGTLASHEGWEGGVYGVGPPVPRMVARVRRWLEEGLDVRIFTARACAWPGVDYRKVEAAINGWCLEQFGRTLPITCVKDYGMIELWDDRAVQVIRDTGERADGMGDEVHLLTPGEPKPGAPRCYYAPDKFCGEESEASIEEGWTWLCRCPSCPVKVAASTAARKARDNLLP